jgi:protein SCO1/2
MAISKRKGTFLGLLIAAILPLSLYLMMRSINDGNIKIPQYYRVDGIEAVQKDGKNYNDTIYHQVKDIELINQMGEKISLNKTLQGKVLVINFMFTTCQSVCPQITREIATIQKAYEKKNPDWVQFISITVDPTRDSVTALRTYSDNYKANHDRWYFLTGSKEAIFNYAKEELGVVLQHDGGVEGVVHSENIILLDKDRYIRGYYNALEPQRVAQCAQDIAILQLQKKRKK